jgi:hypothetical protein
MSKDTRLRFPVEWKPVLRQIRSLGIDRARDMIAALSEENAILEPERKSSLEITSDGLFIIFGCMHYPFHDPDFHDRLCEFIAEHKPDGIIAAGDLLDAYSVSSHNSGQWAIPGLTLQYEYEATNKKLAEIDEAAGKARKVFIEGNHEYRIERAKMPVNNAKLGGAIRDYSEGLRLSERGYEVLRPWKEAYCLLGTCEIIHGEYFNKHAASKHLDVIQRDCIFFHIHRHQSYTYAGKTSLSPGWGGDPNAPVFRYRSRLGRKAWQHGFAVAEVKDGVTKFWREG